MNNCLLFGEIKTLSYLLKFTSILSNAADGDEIIEYDCLMDLML
ncbi:hypothetical protein JCM19301_841 [Jejuia pallidilutea]|uniref:Uncharacterized protein n=1 Tax=Jejuia pallidilutea TaxID=504487 RepID=A0A090W343_9FLAO|nr:hypothetical protein JCM19301_841 [Jejuia pallidilutea]GAL71361.1 hypothetical protein JCM19302_1039 [Jejuia pallidilutea]